MALATNQHGYDVVSTKSEHISVKTITTSTYIGFNPNMIEYVHRIIILRINIDDDSPAIEELLDEPIADAMKLLQPYGQKLAYYIPIRQVEPVNLEALAVIAQASDNDTTTIKKFENGAISVDKAGERVEPAKPILRALAKKHHIALLNSNGNPKNTRQLGSDIIRAIEEWKNER